MTPWRKGEISDQTAAKKWHVLTSHFIFFERLGCAWRFLPFQFLCVLHLKLHPGWSARVLGLTLFSRSNSLLLPWRPVNSHSWGLGLEYLEKYTQNIKNPCKRISESMSLLFIFTVFHLCILKVPSLPGFINLSPLLWGQEWAVYLHFTDVQTEWQVVPRAAFRRLVCSI